MIRYWYNTSSMKGIRRMQDEQGMVSFTVTLIMILVITLIVLGFSQVTRRNEREALDRQLSSQAFYAAESGINVTATKIKDYVALNGNASMSDKKACTSAGASTDYDPGDPAGQGTPIQKLSADGSVKYTCVLVNPHPKTLIYDVSQDGSTVAPITSTGNIKTLKFQWFKQANTTDTSCAGASGYIFPPLASWTCGYGVIRIDLVSIPTGGTFTSANLANNAITLFLTPLGGGGGAVSVPNYTSKKAYVVSGNGCGTGTCQAVVTLPGDSASYYARLISTYRNASNTTISGTLAGGGAATFVGSQAVVDVTGQDQDELRRVQTRIALIPTANDIPQSALSSSADICKRFSLTPSDDVDPSNLCGGAPAIPGNLNNQFSTNDPSGSGGGGNNGGPLQPTGPIYGWTFHNTTSSSLDSSVKSCVWKWGDGTKDGGGSASDPNSACKSGQTIFHQFPTSPGDVCKAYTVTLISTFNNNTATWTQTISVPHGVQKDGTRYPGCS